VGEENPARDWRRALEFCGYESEPTINRGGMTAEWKGDSRKEVMQNVLTSGIGQGKRSWGGTLSKLPLCHFYRKDLDSCRMT